MPYTFTTHTAGALITSADINALSNAVKYDTTKLANVLEYGAVEGGGTDCTTAFQNALTAVAGTNGAPGTATGGGTVLVPAGIWRVGQLSIPHRTRLLGSGWGTVLRAQSGQTVPMIVNASYNDAGTTRYVHYCTVENLRLDGSDMSSAATGAHGIFFQNPTANSTTTTDEELDGFHRIYRVEIRNVWGDGILIVGRGASDLAHNSVQYAQGNGINIDTDNTITACDCGRNRRNGFKFTGGNIRASNLISWGNGQTNAGVSAQTEVITDLDGNGYRWQGGYRGGTYVNLIAQDNRRAGFLFANTPMQMTCYGLDADSNNAFNQTIAATNYAGFEIFGGYSNVLEGKAHDRNASDRGTNPGYQIHTLHIYGANGDTPNGWRINLHHTGRASSADTAPVHPSSTVFNDNEIVISEGGNGSIHTTFAATLTPDPYRGRINRYATVNSAFTVAAPAFYHRSQMMTLQFVKDATATAYAITWNAIYKTTVTAMPTTASGYLTVTFYYDGTNWVQTGSSSI